MEYAHYTVEDFILDDYFQRWVKQPDVESNLFWTTWLASNPHKREIIEEARQAILELKFREDVASQEDFIQTWQKISAINDTYDRKTKRSRGFMQIIFRKPSDTWYKVAAVFIGFLLVTAAVWMYVNTYAVIKYNTRYGETKTIILPDSSRVILNANSQLTFSPGWNKQNDREVWLEGEAFFSVVHTANHQKFLVHISDDFGLEVLGTEFNVYRRKSNTRVVLNSGKVKLNIRKDNSVEQVVMNPGELVEVDESADSHIKKEVNPELFSAWTQKELIFSDTPIREIITLLEENYGLTVEIQDKSILNRKISGSVPSDNLQSLLFALSETLQYHITKNGNHVTFQKNQLNNKNK